MFTPGPQRAPNQTCTVGRRQAAVGQLRTWTPPARNGRIRPRPLIPITVAVLQRGWQSCGLSELAIRRDSRASTMDEYELRQNQVNDRLIAARFNFWSVMLTSHTVLLSVSVALLTGAPKNAWIFKLVGFIAIACILFLLGSFALAKAQYEAIAYRLAFPAKEISEAEKQHDMRKAKMRYWLVKVLEITSAVGLTVAAVLLGWSLGIS